MLSYRTAIVYVVLPSYGALLSLGWGPRVYIPGISGDAIGPREPLRTTVLGGFSWCPPVQWSQETRLQVSSLVLIALV